MNNGIEIECMEGIVRKKYTLHQGSTKWINKVMGQHKVNKIGYGTRSEEGKERFQILDTKLT